MFKNLSIFSKIGFGFGIILLFLLILGLISINSINSMTKQANKEKMTSDIAAEIQNWEIDHLKYINTVSTTISDETATSIDVKKDPTKCKLGLFLDGPKRVEYEKTLSGIKDVFSKIEEPHRKLHDSVVKLEEMMQSEEATEAELKAYFKDYTMDAIQQIETQFEAAGSLVEASRQTARQELQETESTVKMFLILGIIVALIFSIIIALSIRRALLKPIQRVVQFTEVLAAGDLTQRVETFNDDEIGTIISAINLMAEKLDNSFFEVATNSLMLQTSAEALSKVSSSLSDAAHTMNERANNVASASEEMSVTMANVSESSKIATGNVETVSQNTNELTTTVDEIARNSEKARQISQDAVKSVHGASEQVDELGSAAQDINKVVEVIVDIAEQTKLLALNATIEAARAGEAGKGFAVVANEVKELAQQTNNATEEIRKSVDAMQRSTSNTVNEINKINDVIGEVDEIVSTIAAAVEEQNVATRDISANISQVSEGIIDMGHNVAQTAEVAKSVASDVAEVSAASEAVYSESSLVDAHTNDLQEVNRVLTEVVQQFKISKNISEADIKKEYMPWTDKYKLGVVSIDNQHKRLVQLINNLHNDMREQRSIDNINKTMKGLVDYTLEHFSFEEELQKKAAYPGLSEHKEVHQKLVGQVQEYANKLAAGDMMISRDLMRFLKDWLSNHILKTDAQYAPYMKKAGL